MSTESEICNLALSHLGVGKEISNLSTDQGLEATTCRRFFDICRDIVLRDFQWPFATKIEALALIEEEPNDDWLYSYRYPTDALYIRRILSGLKIDSPNSLIRYKVSQDTAGLVIYSDLEEAQIEYTKREDNPERFPPDFSMALSFRLASYLAPRLTGGDPFKLGDRAMQMYRMEITSAAKSAFNEQKDEKTPDTEFYSARNS